MLGQIYTTKKDILNAVQEIAQFSGFAVTTKSSGHRHFHIQCKRGGQPRNTSNLTADTRQKKKMSKRCGCPYLLKAVPRDSKWKVVEVINRHNHPKAKNARVFHEHRRLTHEAKRTAVQMLKAGAKPSAIYEAIRDENGEPTATRRDILNLGSRIHISEENASMEALILGMEKRGYTVRRENQNDHIIHSRDYEALNLAIAPYKALSALSFNANEVMKYFDRKIKEKWVGFYTSRIMHFNATTTQRVEGAHSAMKRAIEASGSLTKSFNSLDRWLRLHYEELSLQYENERRVTQFALNQIKNELLSVTTYKACLCELRVNYNLPCRYMLPLNEPIKNVNFLQNGSTFYIEDTRPNILLNSRIPVDDVDQICNPKSDGNCGFRALAIAIRGNEENWNLVKLAMNESWASPCPSSFWFLSPDCAQLAANTFTVSIAIFDEKDEQCTIFFPLESAPIHRRNPI
ncbi:8930_t:CDS:2, partial [Gigaspora rosea]